MPQRRGNRRGAWHGAWRVETRLGSGAGPQSLPIGISFDPTPRPRIRYAEAPLFPGYGSVGLYLPIRVTGIPAGSGVVSQRVAVTLEDGGGRRWSSGWRPAGAVIGVDSLADARFINADGPAWQYLEIDRAFYEAVKVAPVRIRVSIALVLLSGSRTGAMEGFGRKWRLPHDGICEAKPIPTFSQDIRGARGMRNVEAFCAWPQPGPARSYVRTASPSTSKDSYALLAASAAGIVSIDQSAWRREGTMLAVRGSDPRFTVETWDAAGYLERSLEFSGVVLKDHVAPRATDPQ